VRRGSSLKEQLEQIAVSGSGSSGKNSSSKKSTVKRQLESVGANGAGRTIAVE